MEPFIGQIILFAGNFAPRGWAFCNGQLMDIATYQALFSILGTTYGGDGRQTFALPDLRGRMAMHAGNGPGLTDRRLGEKGGSETETLTSDQLPTHQHQYTDKSSQAGGTTPNTGHYFPVPASWGKPLPSGGSSTPEETTGNTGQAGGGAAHNNLPPYQCLNFIIALQGIYPSRS